LSNGTAYTFTVTATHANGNSPASSTSNSVSPVNPVSIVTGGTLASDATYYYRTFTANGTLSISSNALSFDYLVIAGGASGGNGVRSGSAGTGFTYNRWRRWCRWFIK
jgi:hypothetical protein